MNYTHMDKVETDFMRSVLGAFPVSAIIEEGAFDAAVEVIRRARDD